MSRVNAWKVVDEFEKALCEYTGGMCAVAVDSCTNAIFLTLKWLRLHYYNGETHVTVPKHTYVGVAQAVLNAGYQIEWSDEVWVGEYQLHPFLLFDAAKRFHRGMYHGGVQCVSFHSAKILNPGRGGAILHDNLELDEWVRRARFDGRDNTDLYDNPSRIQVPGWRMYMEPAMAVEGLRRLSYIADDNPDQVDVYPDLSKLMP